jgi:hypothetical protein
MGSDYGIIITDLVMTFAELSAAHENTVCTGTKGLDNKERIHPSSAHDPYNSNIWRILKAGHSR